MDAVRVGKAHVHWPSGRKATPGAKQSFANKRSLEAPKRLKRFTAERSCWVLCFGLMLTTRYWCPGGLLRRRRFGVRRVFAAVDLDPTLAGDRQLDAHVVGLDRD
jgi:hypothetical protein